MCTTHCFCDPTAQRSSENHTPRRVKNVEQSSAKRAGALGDAECARSPPPEREAGASNLRAHWCRPRGSGDQQQGPRRYCADTILRGAINCLWSRVRCAAVGTLVNALALPLLRACVLIRWKRTARERCVRREAVHGSVAQLYRRRGREGASRCGERRCELRCELCHCCMEIKATVM